MRGHLEIELVGGEAIIHRRGIYLLERVPANSHFCKTKKESEADTRTLDTPRSKFTGCAMVT